MESKHRQTNSKKSVRYILLMGVFWRILFIEAVLLVYSLVYKGLTENVTSVDLFWYGVRIIILVIIIIVFMMITLKKFLTRRIITPLERISQANTQFMEDGTPMMKVDLDKDAPAEIENIVTSRTSMLKTILKVSEERLNLVNFIRDTFGKYLSKKVVDQILESPKGRKIGGRRKRVTIVMSDLRGFTNLSETTDPGAMMDILNRYLERMSAVILKYDGIIDEIIGDAVLAVFGAIESRADDPERAVACAIEMQNALIDLNRDIKTEGYPPFEMGIGINTGDVIVGNIGSDIRMKYGIVGATVNTCARIESNTIGGQVLIGENTYSQVKDAINCSSAMSVMMKGLKRPLVFYSVFSIQSRFKTALRQSVKDDEGLDITLPFLLQVIKGKVIDPRPISGETVRLNETHMDIRTSVCLEPYTDVKLELAFCDEVHCFEPIYAKVTRVAEEKENCLISLTITSLDPKDREMFLKWMDK